MTTGSKPPLLARPRDEGLQAYKAGISEFHELITGRTVPLEEITEVQWIEAHRQFRTTISETGKGEGGVNA